MIRPLAHLWRINPAVVNFKLLQGTTPGMNPVVTLAEVGADDILLDRDSAARYHARLVWKNAEPAKL